MKNTFLESMAAFNSALAELKNYFVAALAEFGVQDLHNDIYLSPNYLEEKPYLIIGKRMLDDSKLEEPAEMTHRQITMVFGEKTCEVKLEFSDKFGESEIFACPPEKLAELDFVKELAELFLDSDTNFHEKINRSRFLKKLSISKTITKLNP